MIIEYAAEKRSVSVEAAARLFEKTCFGGQELSSTEFDSVYSVYRSSYKYLRKIPKVKVK